MTSDCECTDPFIIYEVYDTDYDGRFTGSLGFFAKKQAADNIKSGNLFLEIRESFAIKTFGKIYILKNAKPIDLDLNKKKAEGKLKAQALKKLTPEEIQALGIK